MLPFYLVRAENRPAARCHKWRVVVRFPADASGKRRTRSCTVEGLSLIHISEPTRH